MHSQSQSGAVQRVLIYRLGSLGDTIVALPCYHQVARAFPEAKRWLLTNLPVAQKAPSPKEILGDSGLVHAYIGYPVGLRSIRGLLRLRREIRELRPQVLIYLAAPRGIRQAQRDAVFFRMCGIPRIIGLPLTQDLQENRWDAQRQMAEPEAHRLTRCLSEIGPFNLDAPPSWDLLLTDDEHRTAESVLAPLQSQLFVAVSVGTKMQSKDWGVENWGGVLERIHAEYPGYGLALVGAGSEASASEKAARRWGGKLVNLCGALTPRETAAVLERATLFLGHDSGPMHLAEAVQTPCVAVFAALRPPGVWFPYGRQHRVVYHKVECANCGLDTCIVQGKKCITSITVDEVMKEVQHLLGAHADGNSQLHGLMTNTNSRLH